MSVDPDNMTPAEIDQMWADALAWRDKFRSDYAGSIYAVLAGDFVKVGFTKGDVSERIAKLQTGCPLPLQLIATGPGGRYMERSLHDLLKRFRVHGEWFRADPLVLESIHRFCTTRH